MRVRWQAGAPLLLALALAGCDPGPTPPPATPTPNAQGTAAAATARAIVAQANMSATAIARAADTRAPTATVAISPTVAPVTSTPRGHALPPMHPPTSTPAPSPTATATAVPSASGPWQVSVHGVTVAAAQKQGWTDLSFRMVLTNAGRGLLDLSQLLANGQIQGSWHGALYAGPIHFPAIQLPPGYSVQGSAQIEVPRNPLQSIRFQVITPAGPAIVAFAATYPPEPSLPTTHGDQQPMGKTVRLPSVADLTITAQSTGPFYTFGDLSSNWQLDATWTNESGEDATLGTVVRLLKGKTIFDAAVHSTTLPPLTSGSAILHVPELGTGDHYLVVTSPGSNAFGVYRIKPTVPAETWQIGERTMPEGSTLWSSYFDPDGKQGWIVGEGGTILHTADGGATWNAQQSPTQANLYAITFTRPGFGWIVGSKGTILHTADGGNTWAAATSITTQYLSNMAFSDQQHGWIVGNNGTLLLTADGGLTWEIKSGGGGHPLTTQPLTAVAFPDATDGWLIGNDGVILHTPDGGVSWVAQDSGVVGSLNGMTFLDASHGWIVGSGGVILSTADGGKTWVPHVGITSRNLFNVTFQDSTHGWIVGDAGLVLHTVDGGDHWYPVTDHATGYLLDLVFAGARNGWALGQNGALMHIARVGA